LADLGSKMWRFYAKNCPNLIEFPKKIGLAAGLKRSRFGVILCGRPTSKYSSRK
jgi:hypothetical protein